eukprot:8235323-Pyramimonas_sp.AAC.2
MAEITPMKYSRRQLCASSACGAVQSRSCSKGAVRSIIKATWASYAGDRATSEVWARRVQVLIGQSARGDTQVARACYYRPSTGKSPNAVVSPLCVHWATSYLGRLGSSLHYFSGAAPKRAGTLQASVVKEVVRDSIGQHIGQSQ